MSEWQQIATAPKDGSLVWLCVAPYEACSPDGPVPMPARCSIGRWDPEGTSWVNEYGTLGADDVCQLAETGIWLSGGGWFQPNEVTHWMPLPEPPVLPPPDAA